MHSSTKRLIAVLGVAGFGAVALGFSQAANAAVMSVTFGTPTYADGALNAPSPTTDTTTPGQDGWINTSGGGTNNIPVSNAATNGLVSLTTSGQDVRKLFDGAASFNTLSVYFTADINVSAAQATGDYALHLGDGSITGFFARMYIKSSGTGYVLAEGTSSGAAVTYGTTVLPFNTVQRVLVRYDFVAGGTTNDTGALYVNPTSADGTGDTPYVLATTTGTDATAISSFSLRQGTAGSAATLTVDNIVANTGLPEPGSIAVLGIASLGMLARRRKAV
jgi:hypothetical protein